MESEFEHNTRWGQRRDEDRGRKRVQRTGSVILDMAACPEPCVCTHRDCLYHYTKLSSTRIQQLAATTKQAPSQWGESHRITVLQLYGTGTQALSNLLARTSTPRSRAPMEFREQPKDSPGPVPRIRNIFFYTVLPKIPRVEESCPHVTARQHQECTWQHPPTTDMKQAARNPTPASSEWALAFSTPAIQLDTITNISPLPGERPAWKSFV